MPIKINKIDFFGFDVLFKTFEPNIIDLYISSYSSFLFLKNDSFHCTLKSVADSNSCRIRVIAICERIKFESVHNFFSSIKNVTFNHILSSWEPEENIITLAIDKKTLFFFNIFYDTSKNELSCTLYRVIFDEFACIFNSMYDSMWNTMEKNTLLEKHNLFQQDFIDMASHQLRNPILPIVGFSKILKSKIKDSIFLDYLDIIVRNGEKLKDIANDMLDISRIETNSLKINSDYFDIDLILNNIISEYRNITLRDAVNVKLFYYGKPNVVIKGDKSIISHALCNLLNNSYYFTKNNQGNEIIIRLLQDDDSFVTITIEDQGYSIPEKDLGHMFTKFFAKTSGGTGLGLFISKKLFELHGGNITVKNRMCSRGLKFVVKIPHQI